MKNIKKYNTYKASGIAWLGDIPTHWEKWKLNRVLFFQEGPGLRNWQFKDNGVKVICVTNIVPPKIDFSKMSKYISLEEYEDKYKHFTVDSGDILLASSVASWGKVSTYRSDEKVILNTILNEQKAGIINATVTKGGDPSVKMKDSGIEWLGDVPQHWEVRKLKYVAEVLRGKFTPRPRNDPKYYDGQYPFVQTGNVATADKYIETYNQTLNELGYEVSKEFPVNSIVMTIAANIADVAILKFNACFPDSIIGFKPFDMIDVDFLYYQLKNLRPEFFRIAIK